VGVVVQHVGHEVSDPHRVRVGGEALEEQRGDPAVLERLVDDEHNLGDRLALDQSVEARECD
jgi:hypothetical protein